MAKNIAMSTGVFAFWGFLNTLIPVFENSNFSLIYSEIHFLGAYFSEFLAFIKPWNTITPAVIQLSFRISKIQIS